jgi:hypothetical protein
VHHPKETELGEIGIDTNFFINLLKNEQLRTKFTAYLKLNKKLLVIPANVWIELLGPKEFYNDLKVFQEWYSSNTNLFKFGSSWDNIIKEEFKQTLESTPNYDKQGLNKMFSDPNLLLENSVINFSGNYHRKKEFKIKDQNLHKIFNALSPEEKEILFEQLLNKPLPAPNHFWFDKIKEIVPSLVPEDIIQNPFRYKTAFALTALSSLYVHLRIFDETFKKTHPSPLWKFSKTDLGRHEDYVIFSECSYCKEFITQDEGLHGLCEHLYIKNLIFTKPIPFTSLNLQSF